MVYRCLWWTRIYPTHTLSKSRSYRRYNVLFCDVSATFYSQFYFLIITSFFSRATDTVCIILNISIIYNYILLVQKTRRDVAIKKRIRPLRYRPDAERTYRELKLLTYLNHPDAQVCTTPSRIFFKYFLLKCIQLLNVFTPEKNLNDFQTVYVEKILLLHERV